MPCCCYPAAASVIDDNAGSLMEKSPSDVGCYQFPTGVLLPNLMRSTSVNFVNLIARIACQRSDAISVRQYPRYTTAVMIAARLLDSLNFSFFPFISVSLKAMFTDVM